MPGHPFRRLKRFLADRRGGVSVVLVLMIIPLIGVLGMATEASSWFLMKRAAQNAADSAAMAAALNACVTGTCTATSATYDQEAKAVASQFGFTDGQSNTTVTATAPVACPGGAVECYQVAISRKMPINLVQLVGYRGDSVISDGRAQTISALAIASPPGPPDTYCISALGTASNSIEFKGGGGGGADLDFGGCNFESNGGASCTNKVGTTTNIGFSDVKDTGDGKNCGTERSTSASIVDNFAALASSIPNQNTGCSGGFPKADKKSGVVAAANRLSGSHTFSMSTPQCGDVQLTGNVTVSSDSVLLINNGRLDLNGFKLSTTGGAALTIVFSGTTGSSGIVTGSGASALDYSAPSSSSNPWHGVALYVNPSLPSGSGIDFTYSGNSPAFDITGLIYAPKSNITISGAINHATAGLACLGFMANTISSNGTVDIFAKPTIDCTRAGLTLPTVPGTATRQALVQ